MAYLHFPSDLTQTKRDVFSFRTHCLSLKKKKKKKINLGKKEQISFKNIPLHTAGLVKLCHLNELITPEISKEHLYVVIEKTQQQDPLLCLHVQEMYAVLYTVYF